MCGGGIDREILTVGCVTTVSDVKTAGVLTAREIAMDSSMDVWTIGSWNTRGNTMIAIGRARDMRLALEWTSNVPERLVALTPNKVIVKISAAASGMTLCISVSKDLMSPALRCLGSIRGSRSWTSIWLGLCCLLARSTGPVKHKLV